MVNIHYFELTSQLTKYDIFYNLFFLYAFFFGIAIFIHEPFIETSSSESFLIAAMESTAAIVAILFAITILAVQHTSSNYTSTILERFKHDSKFWFTLLYCIWNLIFIGINLAYSIFAINTSLFFFSSMFGLMSVYFLYIFNKINPISLVNEMQHNMKLECIKVKLKLKDQLKRRIKKDKTGKIAYVYENMPDILAYTILKEQNDFFTNIKKYELTLRQIIFHSIKKSDYDATKAGLSAYPILFENYLNIIPSSSWIDDKFITKTLEDMKTYFMEGIQNKDSIFLEYVIETFKQSGIVFSNNVDVVSIAGSNNFVILCNHYIEKICQTCLDSNMYDQTAVGMRAIGDLGIISCLNNRNDQLAMDKLLQLAKEAILKKDFFVPTVMFQQGFKLIQALIKSTTNNYITTKAIDDLSKLLYVYIKVGFSSMHTIGFFTNVTTVGALPCLVETLMMPNPAQDQFVQHNIINYQKKIIPKLINLVTNVGKAASEIKNTPVIAFCADCLVHMTSLLSTVKIENQNNLYKEELDHIIRAFVNLYNPHDTHVYNDSDEVINSLIDVILYCIKNKHYESAKHGINYLYYMAINTLDKNTSKHHSVSILRSLDIVGCYLMAYNQYDVAIIIADKYCDFDDKYTVKFNEISLFNSVSLEQYNFSQHDTFMIKYRPIDELHTTITPDNGKKFEQIILDVKSIRDKANQKNRS